MVCNTPIDFELCSWIIDQCLHLFLNPQNVLVGYIESFEY
jgi:hypothetical protein